MHECMRIQQHLQVHRVHEKRRALLRVDQHRQCHPPAAPRLALRQLVACVVPVHRVRATRGTQHRTLSTPIQLHVGQQSATGAHMAAHCAAAACHCHASAHWHGCREFACKLEIYKCVRGTEGPTACKA